MMNKKRAISIIKNINERKLKVLVIGDIMLDHYIYGRVERISPEAPVPIVNFKNEDNVLGGCGNVIKNLVNLGVNVSISTIIGDDQAGLIIKKKLEELNVSIDGLHHSRVTKTTKKTRLISSGSHLIRLDKDGCEINDSEYDEIFHKFKFLTENIDYVIISDYNKGYCKLSFINNVINYIHSKGIPFYVDPKGTNWNKYSKATCVTPNVKEIEEIINYKLISKDQFHSAGIEIMNNYNIKSCLITRGSKGMFYVDNHNKIHQEVNVIDVYDVSGAGDTVIASFSICDFLKFTKKECLEFATLTSSKVVGYTGTKAFDVKMI
jgi:D-beta-D-heptose 7-phosphate kinase/D-beta-D-heptose 1-phosphate adenosyltransferase